MYLSNHDVSTSVSVVYSWKEKPPTPQCTLDKLEERPNQRYVCNAMPSGATLKQVRPFAIVKGNDKNAFCTTESTGQTHTDQANTTTKPLFLMMYRHEWSSMSCEHICSSSSTFSPQLILLSPRSSILCQSHQPTPPLLQPTTPSPEQIRFQPTDMLQIWTSWHASINPIIINILLRRHSRVVFRNTDVTRNVSRVRSWLTMTLSMWWVAQDSALPPLVALEVGIVIRED